MFGIATVTIRAQRVRGATLAEVVVATAILAIIGSIVISTDLVVSPNDRERYAAAADTLNELAVAIAYSDATNAQTSFKWVIQKYPQKLSQLTKPITNADRDICGNLYINPTHTSRWTTPFWPKELRTTGTTLVQGFDAQDNLATFPDANLGFSNNTTGVRQAAPTGGISTRNDGVIAIRMTNVTLDDAEGLDGAVDGTVDGTAGVVRYSSATDPTTVDYYITVSGC
jgi:hypothetical protein